MVSISLTASKGFTAVVSCISGQGGVRAVIPASTEQKEVEKSVKMSWITNTAVERRSARGEVRLGSSVPEVQAKGIAD
jgi:hypothetical protein